MRSCFDYKISLLNVAMDEATDSDETNPSLKFPNKPNISTAERSSIRSL